MRSPRSILVIALTLLLPLELFAQGKPQPARFVTGSSAKLAVDIDNNIILMKVRVNGSRPLKFVFDTGASMSTIDEQFVKELGLTVSDSLKGSGTGGNFTGSFVKSATLAVDGAEILNQPIAATPLNAPPGFEFDGIIGYDFINAFVVEVDYENKTATLYDPAKYRYHGKGTTVPLNLARRKTPLVRTLLGLRGRPSFFSSLELDTAFDAAFLLNNPLVKRENLLRYFKHGAESSGHGAGGEQNRLMVTFNSAGFGTICFKDVPVALSLETAGSDADPTSDGVIGGEVFRRFRVIIDYSRSRMILERNKSFAEPFEVDGE